MQKLLLTKSFSNIFACGALFLLMNAIWETPHHNIYMPLKYKWSYQQSKNIVESLPSKKKKERKPKITSDTELTEKSIDVLYTWSSVGPKLQRSCNWICVIWESEPHPFVRWNELMCMHACSGAQSCPTLCDHMDCSSPDFSVHGILQARILEWVGMPFSRESSWSRDWTCVSCISCIAVTGGSP